MFFSYLEPPKIDEYRASSQNLSVVAEKSIIIECPAEGTPSPKIIWMKNGEEIYFENEPYKRLLSDGRRLEITQADPSDSGEYTCVAKNIAGKVHRTFNLDVWG